MVGKSCGGNALPFNSAPKNLTKEARPTKLTILILLQEAEIAHLQRVRFLQFSFASVSHLA